MSKQVFIITVLFILSQTIIFGQNQYPKREVRAVWISTVYRIDWPSSTKISAQKQKQELVQLLDKHKKNGMNTIIFQVRPAGDAFYYSTFEPWSLWLTGEQGLSPYPFYDPLQFIVDECHKRNMELHAWFNPFRAVVDTQRTVTSELHISRLKPDWFFAYGKNLYFDPGIPEARKFIASVVSDVVRRYDIDGVHFDDYFYPYKIKGQELPDTASFRLNRSTYNDDKKDDWRRNNVNNFVKMISDSINTIKPFVKFGIGPFGIWRNKSQDPNGSQTRGLSAYDQLYADSRKWLQEGWIDYIAPQLYWHIGHKRAEYKTLVNWWSSNCYGKHLYIGQAVSSLIKHKNKAWDNPSEMPNQIRLNRSTKGVYGSIYFSSRSFKNNPKGICDTLQSDLYRYPALIPPMEWKDKISPPKPTEFIIQNKDKNIILTWKAFTGNQVLNIKQLLKKDTAAYYVIYRFKGKTVENIDNSSIIYSITKKPELKIEKEWALFRKKYTFVVTAVDRQHNESDISNSLVLKMKK